MARHEQMRTLLREQGLVWILVSAAIVGVIAMMAPAAPRFCDSRGSAADCVACPEFGVCGEGALRECINGLEVAPTGLACELSAADQQLQQRIVEATVDFAASKFAKLECDAPAAARVVTHEAVLESMQRDAELRRQSGNLMRVYLFSMDTLAAREGWGGKAVGGFPDGGYEWLAEGCASVADGG